VPAPSPAGRRVVFLDIDGTLAFHGVVPDAHVDAVRAVRSAGHRVLLATGRPRAMLSDELLGIGFDGLVGSAGCWVEVDGDVLQDRRIPEAAGRPIVERLTATEALFVLESPEQATGPIGTGARLRAAFAATDGGEESRLLVDITRRLVETDDLRSAPAFAKITVFDGPDSMPELAALAGGAIGWVPPSIAGLTGHAGELHLADVHKASGIDLVLAHLGLDRAAGVAIGDGANDLEMLEHAGTAVAIEGSDPRLLAHADLVVPGPEHEGLVVAFRELGLLPAR
jgi:hydroxymethylpyrimidine pyrophosphatase-like HAD family hydrolase